MNTFDVYYGVYSAEQVRSLSSCRVESYAFSGYGSLGDTRMGIIENEGVCATCEQTYPHCPGHFGHIELPRPVYNPVLSGVIQEWRAAICKGCNSLRVSLRDGETVREFLARSRSPSRCEFCGTRDSIARDATPTEYLQAVDHAVSDDVLRSLGVDPVRFHPRNLVIVNLPVIPPCARPYLMQDGHMCHDDLTELYADIIKFSRKSDGQKLLCQRLEMLMVNSENRARYSNSRRATKSIVARVRGKEGRIRSNIMGKRCEQSARGVIGPDPTLLFEQVGVPELIARTLTVPVRITQWNRSSMQELVRKGEVTRIIRSDGSELLLEVLFHATRALCVGDTLYRPTPGGHWIATRIQSELQRARALADLRMTDVVVTPQGTDRIQSPCYSTELEIGDTAYRKLAHGDLVIINRQPTLHKPSMMAARARVIPGNVIKLNLAITKPFNADFDGDEMNIHVPQTEPARAELEMMTPRFNIVSAQSPCTNIAIVQDGLLGVYKWSHVTEPIPLEEFFNLVFPVEMEHVHSTVIRASRILPGECRSGRILLSMAFPEGFFYHHAGVRVVNGILVQGILTKKVLGGSKDSILLAIKRSFGPDAVSRAVDALQDFGVAYVQREGFSIGLRDCFCSLTARSSIARMAKEGIERAHAYNDIRDVFIREQKILGELERTKDRCMRAAKFGVYGNNRFIDTIESGSKGDYFNLAQVSGLLGQQHVNGKRIPITLSNDRRTLPHYPFTTPSHEARGFISCSFSQGLDPRSFFFHSMSGRQGIVDTAVGTSQTGYIQRRLVKGLENAVVGYDGAVRSREGYIVQFTHNRGRDMFSADSKGLPVDVQALAQSIVAST